MVVYLDDIVVYGATSELHDDRLAKVLDVLVCHNLTLKEEKHTFAASVIKFVGFRLAAGGLSPLHSNVDAVLCLPEPSMQLSLFLGMTAFYLRFLLRDHCTAALSSSRTCPGPGFSDAVRQFKVQLTSRLGCACQFQLAEPHVCDL